MRIALISLGALVAFVALVFLAGLFLPRTHTTTSEITLRQPPDSVWTVLRDIGGMPRWTAIKVSERVTDAPGERWRQESGGNRMMIDVVEDVQPHRFTSRIVEEKGAPFGGTWTFEVAPSGGGSRVTITENGWIGPPPFRVIATLMGLHKTMDGMLTGLAKHFAENSKPSHR